MSKVLVIDDSAMMRRVLRHHLEEAGFEVEDWLPLSAMEIPERIKASAPELVLTDYHMPGVNGLTVAKMVAKVDPKIPVVVLTALRDAEVEASLQKFEVKKVLSKPISGEDLVGAIRDLLSK